MTQEMDGPEEVLESILTADGRVRVRAKNGGEAVVEVVEQSDPLDGVQAVYVDAVDGSDVPGERGRAEIRSEQNEDASWSRPVAHWVGPPEEDLNWALAEAEEVSRGE